MLRTSRLWFCPIAAHTLSLTGQCSRLSFRRFLQTFNKSARPKNNTDQHLHTKFKTTAEMSLGIIMLYSTYYSNKNINMIITDYVWLSVCAFSIWKTVIHHQKASACTFIYKRLNAWQMAVIVWRPQNLMSDWWHWHQMPSVYTYFHL